MFSAKIDQHDDLKDQSNKEYPSTSSLILHLLICCRILGQWHGDRSRLHKFPQKTQIGRFPPYTKKVICNFFAAPQGQYYSKARRQWQERARL